MSDVLSRLRALDGCTVSDALDADGIAGAVSGLRPMWEGAMTAGRVFTVLLAEGPTPAGSPATHLGARAIAECGPDDVIVVANGGRTSMGAWGGLLSLAARYRGIAGMVTDGACRDVDEARQLGFPAFAAQPVTRTARGRVHEAATGLPVEIRGHLVAPGDYVIADGSGVVFVPAGRIEQVLARGEAIAAKEQQMRAALERGADPTAVLDGSYEHMLRPGPGTDTGVGT